MSNHVVHQHMNLIKQIDGEILAVSSDPLTHEMRRDLQPEISHYRIRYLKREFSEQIKLLEVKEVISK